MTVRAFKGSIFTTTGLCLVAGVGVACAAPIAAAPIAAAPIAAAQSAPAVVAPASAPVAVSVPPVVRTPDQIGMPAAAPSLPAGERGYGAANRNTQETVKARYLVQVMEGVLERAVKYAATQMNRRLQAVSPDLLQLSGAARARGFRLDGYGVFFDVEVPAALRQTMSWTYRTNMPNDHTLEQALASLRRVNSGLEGKQRSDADTALKLIELKVRPNGPATGLAYAPSLGRPAGATPASVTASNVSTGDAPAMGNSSDAQAASDNGLTENPDITYEMEVRDALVGAMLAYGTTLTLLPDEWLTIAARDNQNVIVPGDLSETVTVILRIKGSDLAEYKAGRLDEAAARQRVEVREF